MCESLEYDLQAYSGMLCELQGQGGTGPNFWTDRISDATRLGCGRSVVLGLAIGIPVESTEG